MSTSKEEELLKRRLKKLFGNDADVTTKNVQRILKGSTSSSSGKKFFNRKQSSSSFFSSTSLYEANTIKNSTSKKKDSKLKTPSFNCSIVYPQKRTTKKSDQKSQIKSKTDQKSKITTKKNGTISRKEEPKKPLKRTNKSNSAPPTKKSKKQNDSMESIQWNPAWDRLSDEKSRDSNCSCSACQTPSDCSCSHCEESRQNGTKKKKKLTKKKNKSQTKCNTVDLECCFNTSDFDSDFDPSSITKSKNTTKKTNGKKSQNSTKKEKSSTTSKMGKSKTGKRNNNDDVWYNEEVQLEQVDLNIVDSEATINGEVESRNNKKIKLNGETTKKRSQINLKKEKKEKKTKKMNETIDEENKSKIITHQKSSSNNAASLLDGTMDYYTPEFYSNDDLMGEEIDNYSDVKDDFNDSSDTEDDFDDYSDSEDDFDDYSYTGDDIDDYIDDEEYFDDDFSEEETDMSSFADFEDDSNDSDYQLPDDVNDDIFIASGTAVKYELNKPDVSFDSDCSDAQIVEILPNLDHLKNEKNYLNQFEKNTNLTKNSREIHLDESDDSCPELVPISYETFDTEFEEEEHTSDCYSVSSNSDLSTFALHEKVDENTSMEPTIHTTDDMSDLAMPEFLEIETTISEKDENMIDSLMNKTEISQDCEVVMLQSETKTDENKYELGCEIENFRTEFFNSIDSLQVLVLLRDPIFIYGTLQLQLIAGACEIFGYKPKVEEKLEIFSPRGYSFLNIQALKTNDETKTKAQIRNKIKEQFSEVFMKSDLEELLEKYDEKNHAICLLERNDRSKKFDMLKKYMKQNLIPNMNSITLERPFYSSEFILRCIIRTKTDNAMVIDSKWETIKIENLTKLMIIGGKSVGKSTLLRYIINKNLSKFGKMVLIDLDIGQPEIFVPQTISVTVLDRPLLGPGYFLNVQPKKSMLFGDINVIVNPMRYFEIIKELLEYCYKEEELQNIPWIVNTMGYNKGIGSEIIVLLTKYLNPTDIIQLQSSKEINNYDHIMHRDKLHQITMNIFPKMNENFIANHRLIIFDSIINNKRKSSDWDMKPKDMRFAILITRLGAILNDKYDWLTDCVPISASIDDVNIVSFGEDKLTKTDLLEVINANLVYLCSQSENKTSLECYGIGFVRGIDNFQQKIYLLPSIYNNLLENVNCLAVCNIPMPTSIYLNQGPKIKDITPFAFNTNENASSKYVTQIYYRPKYFLNAGMKNTT